MLIFHSYVKLWNGTSSDSVLTFRLDFSFFIAMNWPFHLKIHPLHLRLWGFDGQCLRIEPIAIVTLNTPMGPKMNRSNLATVSSGVFTTGPLGESVGMLKSPFEFGPSCHGRSLNHQFLTQRALFPASICDPYGPEAEDDGDDGDWNICWDFERNDWGLILKSLILGGSEFEKLSLFRVSSGHWWYD